jgi:dolichol-phosphate mannosyltransferase
MKKTVSIIIPVHNEEENIPLVYKETKKIISSLKYNFEIIFVNDGSSDSSWKQIKTLSGVDKNVKGINFSRNFGHPAALQAGLENALGDAVISMDGDLQHPPKIIKEMLVKWETGAQIVNTVRKSTEGASFFKKISAKLFYKIINSLSGIAINDGEADFRLIDKKVLKVINNLPESPKFYRGIVNWVGFEKAIINYDAPRRKYGNSSFTIKKMFELARIGLTSFSMKPLKLIISIGVILSTVSIIAILVMLYFKFFVSYNYFSTNVILSMLILFVAGMLTTFQGITSLYIIDIYNSSKGRPDYITIDTIGIAKTKTNKNQ